MPTQPKFKKKSATHFNDEVAQLVTDATGNMWFFWIALLFIVGLRVLYPPHANEILLNLENDLQLLLLAANAVVMAKQTRVLLHILQKIHGEEVKIEEEEREALRLEQRAEWPRRQSK